VDPARKPQPKIGILTALAHEFSAVRAMLIAPTEVDVEGRGAGRRYLLGKIKTQAGEDLPVVVALAGMGTNIAAIRTTKMLIHYPSVEIILMVGIAGGVPYPTKPTEHVRLGDIVISSTGGVVQYDVKKEEVGFEQIRSTINKPSAELLEAVQYLRSAEDENKRPWEDHLKTALSRLGWKRPSAAKDVLLATDGITALKHPIDRDRRAKQPRVFFGVIGTSNTLQKNPVRRDALRDKFGVKAIEMEGSAVADATWDEGCGYMVIRGICDYCDASKSDVWQKYSAVAAAAYARAFIGIATSQIRWFGVEQRATT
jgi:nucleoside phosphorylase